MKRDARTALFVVAALCLAACGHRTPAGQPPLAELDAGSLAGLRSEFNGASDETRIVLLLSPT